MPDDLSDSIEELAETGVAEPEMTLCETLDAIEVPDTPPSTSASTLLDSRDEKQARDGYRYPPMTAFENVLQIVEQQADVTVDRPLPRTWSLSGVKTLAGYAEACDCGQQVRHTDGGNYHDRVYIIRAHTQRARYALLTTSREAFTGDEALLVAGERGLRLVHDECWMADDEEIVSRRLDTDRLIDVSDVEVTDDE